MTIFPRCPFGKSRADDSATLYLAAGGDLFTLQNILGHEDLAMTKVYTRIVTSQVMANLRRYSPMSVCQRGNGSPQQMPLFEEV